MSKLLVKWERDLVGYIYPQGSHFFFEYSKDWLGKRPISLSLPLQEEAFTPAQSMAFFENLLPEEEIYAELSQDAKIDKSDTYEFLKRYGRECAGALTISPEEKKESPISYRNITKEIEEIFSQGKVKRSLIAQTKTRLSIAGAQNKLPIVYEKGQIFVPAEHSFSPTTAILKLNNERFQDLNKNEFFCMQLAQKIGLKVAKTALISIGEQFVFLAYRYDRQKNGEKIERIHQEDFCQALGYSRQRKYEESKGPGFSSCAHLLMKKEISENIKAREEFIKCVIFNFILGNCDAHGKNFSLLYQKNKIELAPFYDLVSTRAYPELDQKFAMAIGKTFRFDKIAEHSWKAFSFDMNYRFEKVMDLAQEVKKAVSTNFEELLKEHEKQYGSSPIYETLFFVITEGLKRLEKLR